MNSQLQGEVLSVAIDTCKPKMKLTHAQKFRKASLITSELAAVASYASQTHFTRRMELLQKLLAFWKDGKEVSLIPMEGNN